ncbi:type II toxin-antitoxin system VapB family antitoxin [Acidisoma cellulosilytica]|uniref:Type II toxin-antitoxin system VapB family antitoxin n=1 Tax=Acidisoma cellulosilyticum TaxID=2802395 RepID=A0A964E360_9PROT|nr:type II toxin-antitoxin system VapB family antitoxin [Acidisoma cellulosilyticum]MCB8880034.1 type II toxin-antitoxin system VapB family antitoxin [Acidisoma cellulosilyticum]
MAVNDMRSTVSIDDLLYEKASKVSGIEEQSAVINEALKALIERESARRLVQLGGTEPGLLPPDRRRPVSAS